MKNIILVDFPVSCEWEFKKALEKSSNKKWTVLEYISYRDQGTLYKKILRYVKYFWYPFLVFLNIKKYDSILSWQQFYGLVLAFYCRIFKIKKFPELTIMTFIYKPKKSFLGQLYYKFVKYIVTSEYIKKIIVYSQTEVKYYAKLFNIPEDKFCFTKVAIKDVYTEYESVIENNNYFVSAGRSNRDYPFLVKAWNNEMADLHIVCDTFKGADYDNIYYHNHCYDHDYLELLAKCYASIIILNNEEISSGQLVILKSFMMGKPVIITNNASVSDYVDHGMDGFVINKSEKELKSVINKLKNPQIYEMMSRNARKHFEKEFSLEAMGLTIGKFV